MSHQKFARKDHQSLILIISILIVSSSLIGNYSYSDIFKVAYGQPNLDQKNSKTINSVNGPYTQLKKFMLQI